MRSWAARRKKIRSATGISPGRKLNVGYKRGSAQLSRKPNRTSERLRVCVSCRQARPRSQLVRLTVDYRSGEVRLQQLEAGSEQAPMGRSAYICRQADCLEQALKGHRLKGALQGQKQKKGGKSRLIQWPLEPQLIQDLSRQCTQKAQTCKNTQRKEGSE